MNHLLDLAISLAVTACVIADTGVGHGQAFDQAITSHRPEIQRLVHTQEQARLVGRTARQLAEQTCPHNFNKQWL